MPFIDYLEIVQENGSAITRFNPLIIQDIDKEDYQELALVAVHNTVKALTEILFDQLVNPDEIIREALKHHDAALRYIPAQHLTASIYEFAVAQRPMSLLLVPTEFRTTEMCERAIFSKPFLSKFIKINKVCDSATMLNIIGRKSIKEIDNYSSYDLNEEATEALINLFSFSDEITSIDADHLVKGIIHMDTFVKAVFTKSGNYTMGSYLIKNKIDLNKPIDNIGRRPVHYACMTGSNVTLKGLLDYGVDVNCADDTGLYPVHYSVSHKLAYYSCLGRLIAHPQCDKSVSDKDGNTALHTICGNKVTVFTPSFVQTMIDGGFNIFAKNRYGDAPLELFCDRKDDNLDDTIHEYNTQIVNMFLKKMEECYAKPRISDPILFSVNYAIKYTLYNYNTHLIKPLLNWVKQNPDKYSIYNLCTLAYLVFNEWEQLYKDCPIQKRIEMAKIVFDAGVSVNQIDCCDRTFLHRVCNYNSFKKELIEFLLSAGIDKEKLDRYGKKAIHYAIKKGNMEMVKLLI
jgi:ankyrin repeat protein